VPYWILSKDPLRLIPAENCRCPACCSNSQYGSANDRLLVVTGVYGIITCNPIPQIGDPRNSPLYRHVFCISFHITVLALPYDRVCKHCGRKELDWRLLREELVIIGNPLITSPVARVPVLHCTESLWPTSFAGYSFLLLCSGGDRVSNQGRCSHASNAKVCASSEAAYYRQSSSLRRHPFPELCWC
jgi:hypothetical protein